MKFSRFIFFFTLSLSIFAQEGDRKGHDMTDPIPASEIPNAPVLEIDDAMKAIQVQDGFTLELVAGESQVFNPVTMAFDADGRMWVCEMNTYMPNVDGKNEEAAKLEAKADQLSANISGATKAFSLLLVKVFQHYLF